ncbi:unnamed protein product [Ilex paraguariensis]|uniref:Uncharacterized protein n=1 Tax=Ilex paraguariensis TaxID=185542 RepID=A0ABC8RTX5_9AQUA
MVREFVVGRDELGVFEEAGFIINPRADGKPPGEQKEAFRHSWLGLQRCNLQVRGRRLCRIGREESMLSWLFLCPGCLPR